MMNPVPGPAHRMVQKSEPGQSRNSQRELRDGCSQIRIVLRLASFIGVMIMILSLPTVSALTECSMSAMVALKGCGPRPRPNRIRLNAPLETFSLQENQTQAFLP